METDLKVKRLTTTERSLKGLLLKSGRGMMGKRSGVGHGHREKGAGPETFLRNFCQHLVTSWMWRGKRGKGRHWGAAGK